MLAIVLLIVISLGGYFIYTDTQTKQTNRDFVFDVVKSLDEVHESRGSSDTEKDKENAVKLAEAKITNTLQIYK